MSSKILFALLIVVAVVAAVPPPTPGGNWPPAGGANPWIPPWLSAMPWIPQWTPCTAIGATCLDCSTKLICTKVGGMQKACTDPTMPYCNLGECSATPTAECAPPADSKVPDSPIPA